MASARLGPLLGNISGSLAAVTFSRRGSRIILSSRRSRTPASSPRTALQRAEPSRWLSIWNALSDADKNRWTAYAAMNQRTDLIGNSRTMSPFLWFTTYLPYAEAVIPDGQPPLYGGPALNLSAPPITSTTIAFSASGAKEITLDTPLYPGDRQYLHISIGPGKSTPSAAPRRWIYIGIPRYTAYPIDVDSFLTAANITLQESQYFHLQLRNAIEGYWPSPPYTVQSQASA